MLRAKKNIEKIPKNQSKQTKTKDDHTVTEISTVNIQYTNGILDTKDQIQIQ